MAIINFKASNFIGECLVDEDFAVYLSKMNEVAIAHKISVIVTSALRKDTNVKGAIVTPAQMSNHLVGCAIDTNLKSITTGEYFNSVKMKDAKGLDESFIQAVKECGLRWVGDFHTVDSVHFDNGLNIHSPELWKKKYEKLHS